SLRPAPFEAELGRHLCPSVPDAADDHVVRNEDLLEEHLREVRPAVEEENVAHIDPRCVQVEDELAQAFVAIVLEGRGTCEKDRVLAALSVARPHLATTQDPSATDALPRRAHGREIRS